MSSFKEISSDSVVGWLLAVDGLFSVVMVVVVVIVNRCSFYLKSKTNTVLSDVSAEINTPNLLGSNPLVDGSNGT